MVVSLRVKVDTNRIPQRLEEMRDRLDRHRREPLRKSVSYMNRRWGQNISTKGSIYGSWAEVAFHTMRVRTSLGFDPDDTLVRTGGTLANAIAQGRDAGYYGGGGVMGVRWEFKNQHGYYPLSLHTGFNPLFGQPSRILWAMNQEDARQIQLFFLAHIQKHGRI